jgi:hypothetical protein
MLTSRPSRDRVYALLKILDDVERDVPIEPNYNLTLCQVYKNATTQLIAYTGQLDVLSCCDMKEGGLSLPSWVPDFSARNPSEPIASSDACRRSVQEVDFVEGDIIRAQGVYSATVNRAEQMLVGDTHRPSISHFLLALQKILEVDTLQDIYTTGETTLEAYVRILLMDDTRDSYVPGRGDLAYLEESKLELKSLLTSHDQGPTLYNAAFLRRSWAKCQGRSFFTTSEGYMGLGPEATREGDQVCVLLGSYVPLMLRPTEHNQYLVVGPCFMHGIMNGEALLGPLPPHITHIWKIEPPITYRQPMYLDDRTGEASPNDPRLDPLSVGTNASGRALYASKYLNSGPAGSKFNAAAFKRLGSKLRTFDLV